jgi:hypothetical protein
MAVCLGLALYAFGAVLSQSRQFDQDEFLHVHAAWSMSQGMTPYVDYFDQYTPLFRVLLGPIFRFFAVATDPAEAIAFLFFSRKLMWLLSGLVLALTFWLGRLYRRTDVGCVAVLFLMATEAYWNTTLEIRPDTMAVVLWLLYLVTLIRAVRPTASAERRQGIMFLSSGLFLAFSFLTMQKIVFAFPGLAIGTCFYILQASNHETRRFRLRCVAYQAVGFCIPLLLTAAYFYLHGGLDAFIRANFLNFLKVAGFSPVYKLHQMLYQHPFLGLFGVAGLVGAIRRSTTHPSDSRGEFILVPATLSLLIGLFVIPVPHYQYYIFFLPLLSLFAAAFLTDSVDQLALRRDQLTGVQWLRLAAGVAGVILAALAVLGIGVGSHRPIALILGYWTAVMLGFSALMVIRAQGAAVALFLLGLTVGPVLRLRSELATPDTTGYIPAMRYVIEHTLPTDTVMDGYQGSGVFRPHAYFYWFLPYNDRQRLTAQDKQRLLEALTAGTISPAVIMLDSHLRDVSPAVTAFFVSHYEPVGTGFIWRRKAGVPVNAARTP